MYEMLVGVAPFRAETTYETQIKVINWRQTLVIPDECKLSESSKDLVFKLCTDADTRLTADGIKAHSFFKNFDFGPNLRRSRAPYVPSIKHPTDTSNFETIDHSRLTDWQTKRQRNRLLAQQQIAAASNPLTPPSSQGNQPYSNNGGDLKGVSGYTSEPILYEFTFRRFFDEAYTGDNMTRFFWNHETFYMTGILIIG